MSPLSAVARLAFSFLASVASNRKAFSLPITYRLCPAVAGMLVFGSVLARNLMDLNTDIKNCAALGQLVEVEALRVPLQGWPSAPLLLLQVMGRPSAYLLLTITVCLFFFLC